MNNSNFGNDGFGNNFGGNGFGAGNGGGLFNGMAISQMTVNINGGGSHAQSHNDRQDQIQQRLNGVNNPMGQPLQLGTEVAQAAPKSKRGVFMEFDKFSINSDYSLHPLDIIEPNDDCEPLNEYYEVVVEKGNKRPCPTDSEYIRGEIRFRGKLPPILTLLNHTDIPQENIDMMLFHTANIAKSRDYKSFFLVLEESGAICEGEPFGVSMFRGMALSKREVLNISI